jgi:hypothetical protein
VAPKSRLQLQSVTSVFVNAELSTCSWRGCHNSKGTGAKPGQRWWHAHSRGRQLPRSAASLCEEGPMQRHATRATSFTRGVSTVHPGHPAVDAIDSGFLAPLRAGDATAGRRRVQEVNGAAPKVTNGKRVPARLCAGKEECYRSRARRSHVAAVHPTPPKRLWPHVRHQSRRLTAL